MSDKPEIPRTQVGEDTPPSGSHRRVSRQDVREEPLQSGAVLSDRYGILQTLGSGGMGVVYEAYDMELEERVALKLLWPELGQSRSARKRLRGEVRLARRVSHPNVCRVHDIGTHEGQLYVTMELLSGPTLLHLMRSELAGTPLARRIDVLVQMCSGLEAAHRAGVIHRDVKPDNVIVEDERVVLTDFGIASMRDHSETGVISGTPSYMAPELLRGEDADERLDLYAVGLIAYELLSGQRAIRHESLAAAIIHARERTQLPPLPRSGYPERVHRALSTVVDQVLCSDPEERVESASRLARALADAARGGEELLSGPLASVRRSESSVTSTSVVRAQLRVATALTFLRQDASLQTWDSLSLATPSASFDSMSSDVWLAPGVAERLERVILDLGGSTLVLRDDAVVALFGAPVAHGDDVVRAARAAFALQELTEGGGRIGIDTARVLVRQDASGRIQASGDALKRAERLALSGELGDVRASHATARHLTGRFRTEARSPVHDMARVYAVFAERDQQGHVAERTPLLGRDRELAWIEERVMEVCRERRPTHITVLAEGGFGKSRLRLELIDHLSAKRDMEWLVGRSAPLGETTPLGLLASADERWFAVASAGEYRNQGARFAAARRWLEQRAKRRPVVLVLEDIHWADDASLDFLIALGNELDALPITILSFARPVLEERRPGWRSTVSSSSNPGHVVELGPLDTEAGQEVARYHAPNLSEAALREIVTRASGQPFFIEELARDAGERGWTGEDSLSLLPSSVEAVIQTRLDRLSTEARRVLCEASVIGRVFARGTLIETLSSEGSPVNPLELDDLLMDLERRALLFALPPEHLEDERYAFKHALVRDVAYTQLPPPERRRIHAAVAASLEAQADASPEHGAVSILAQHLDAAGDREAAERAYLRAGRRAQALFAFEEARHAFERARQLSEHVNPELEERYGDVLSQVESAQAALEHYQAALVPELNATTRARLHRKIGTSIQRQGDNATALAWYGRGLEIVAPGGALIPEAQADPREAAALYGALGWLQGYLMGDNALGLPNSEANVRLLEGTHHQRELAQALSRLGANYMRAGRWRDQLWCNQRNLEIGEALRDLDLQSTAHINLGVVYASLGELQHALEHTRYALRLAAHTGSMLVSAIARSNLAGLRLDLGEIEGVEDELHEAIRVGDKIGSRSFLPESYSFLARAAARRGDLEAAEKWARHAVERAQQSTIDRGICSRILASILALRGQYNEAEQTFEAALRDLRDADPFERARTRASRARYRLSRGREAEAHADREQARAVFQSLGAAFDLAHLDDPELHFIK